MAGTADRHDGFVKLRYASFSFVRQSDLAAAQAVRMTLSLWLRWSNAIALHPLVKREGSMLRSTAGDREPHSGQQVHLAATSRERREPGRMAYVAHAGGQQLLQRHDAGVSRPPHHARDPGSYRRIALLQCLRRSRSGHNPPRHRHPWQASGHPCQVSGA